MKGWEIKTVQRNSPAVRRGLKAGVKRIINMEIRREMGMERALKVK